MKISKIIFLVFIFAALFTNSCFESSDSSSSSNGNESNSSLSNGDGSGSSGNETGSAPDSIEQEAVTLPNFPEEAEEIVDTSIEINNSIIDGEGDNQLDDTDSDSLYVEVTLPSNLSRSVSLSVSIYLWVNGESTKLEYSETDEGYVAGGLVPLNDGSNYFLFYMQLESGNEYRTPVYKIDKVEDDGTDQNDSIVGKWRAKQMTSYVEDDETGEVITETEYYPQTTDLDPGYSIFDAYYDISETTIKVYFYSKIEGTLYDEETLSYCPDDDSTYTLDGNTLYFEGDDETESIKLYGDIFEVTGEDFVFTMVRDNSLDFSSAVQDCSF